MSRLKTIEQAVQSATGVLTVLGDISLPSVTEFMHYLWVEKQLNTVHEKIDSLKEKQKIVNRQRKKGLYVSENIDERLEYQLLEKDVLHNQLVVSPSNLMSKVKKLYDLSHIDDSFEELGFVCENILETYSLVQKEFDSSDEVLSDTYEQLVASVNLLDLVTLPITQDDFCEGEVQEGDNTITTSQGVLELYATSQAQKKLNPNLKQLLLKRIDVLVEQAVNMLDGNRAMGQTYRMTKAGIIDAQLGRGARCAYAVNDSRFEIYELFAKSDMGPQGKNDGYKKFSALITTNQYEPAEVKPINL